MNDPSALGAVLAVTQANKTNQIKVTGVDGSPQAVDELKRAGSPFIGSSTQNPAEMVRQAVKIGRRHRSWQAPRGEVRADRERVGHSGERDLLRRLVSRPVGAAPGGPPLNPLATT